MLTYCNTFHRCCSIINGLSCCCQCSSAVWVDWILDRIRLCFGPKLLDISKPVYAEGPPAAPPSFMMHYLDVFTGQKNILQHWGLKLACLYSHSGNTICDVMPLWCTFGFSGYDDFQTEDQVINSRAKHSLRRCNHPVEARWMISLHQNASLRMVTNPYGGRLAVTWYRSRESSYSQLHVLRWVMRNP